MRRVGVPRLPARGVWPAQPWIRVYGDGARDLPRAAARRSGAGPGGSADLLVRRAHGAYHAHRHEVGYGAGTKDTPGAPNVLRVFLLAEEAGEGLVGVVEANLDDMTPEFLAGALESLRGAGAREVFVTPVQGKKHRSAWVVTVLCAAGEEGRFADLLFEHTSTAGVRYSTWQRRELPREEEVVQTPWGPLRVKRLSLPSGTLRRHPEWDDLEALAQVAGMTPFQMSLRLRDLIPGI